MWSTLNGLKSIYYLNYNAQLSFSAVNSLNQMSTVILSTYLCCACSRLIKEKPQKAAEPLKTSCAVAQ